jgi:trigger factor
MQITEVATEGLKREYRVVCSAEEIEQRVTQRLQELSKTVRLPGFRPGKVPVGLLRRRYGASVLGEVLERVVEEGQRRIISEHELRPALRPKIEVTSFAEGQDLEFRLDLEVLPEVPPIDLTQIELVRYVAEPDAERVRKSLENLAEARRTFAPPAEPRAAREGDQVIVDFTGYRDGEPFEGGSAKDLPVVLGSGMLLPGFEAALVGRQPGEAFEVELTVPEQHPNRAIAGRTVVFKGTVKEVREPQPVAIDDELAKAYAHDSLADLEKTLRERLAEEYRRRSRERMKRQLLDWLAEHVQFEVPQGMVELEFENIWKQLQQEMQRTGTSFEQLGRSEEELRAEYRAIAERRVRLGLILSDIGTKNQITVEPQELQQAVLREAQRYPGREREVLSFFREHPQAMEQLRAPIFEDKVVDFIFELARVREEPISVEELFRDPDEEDEGAPPGSGNAAAAAAANESEAAATAREEGER